MIDWLAGLELDAQLPVRPLNADLSTVSAEADTVLGIGDPLSSLVHIEFQSGRDASLARRLLVYNGLLHERFKVPVHSAVILLRRQADGPGMDGALRYETRSALNFVEEALNMVDLRDSSTYQLIVEEGLAKGMAQGMAQGLRTMLIKMAARHLGPPSEVAQESLGAIDDIERLQRMGQRAFDVATWQELLDTA